MGSTPVYGLPWPALPDPANVPGDLQALAQSVEAVLADLAGNLPRMASGSVTVPSVAAGATTAVMPIFFPAGLFTAPPLVLISSGNSRLTYQVSAVTTVGANLYFSNWTAGASPANVPMLWQAIQSSGGV